MQQENWADKKIFISIFSKYAFKRTKRRRILGSRKFTFWYICAIACIPLIVQSAFSSRFGQCSTTKTYVEDTNHGGAMHCYWVHCSITSRCDHSPTLIPCAQPAWEQKNAHPTIRQVLRTFHSAGMGNWPCPDLTTGNVEANAHTPPQSELEEYAQNVNSNLCGPSPEPRNPTPHRKLLGWFGYSVGFHWNVTNGAALNDKEITTAMPSRMW